LIRKEHRSRIPSRRCGPPSGDVFKDTARGRARVDSAEVCDWIQQHDESKFGNRNPDTCRQSLAGWDAIGSPGFGIRRCAPVYRTASMRQSNAAPVGATSSSVGFIWDKSGPPQYVLSDADCLGCPWARRLRTGVTPDHAEGERAVLHRLPPCRALATSPSLQPRVAERETSIELGCGCGPDAP
jgi:hypothetical protein